MRNVGATQGQEARMSDVLTEQPHLDESDTAARAAKTTASALASSGAPALTVGDRIEVRRRFDEEWASGFELAEAVEGGYRVRRRSDGEVLPAVFAAEAVRAERRRRRNMWWY